MTTQINIQMVDLLGQYLKIKEEIDEKMARIIETCAFVGGPAVHEFNLSLAKYLGVKHVTGCGNGTDAIMIALMALDLKPGDEVITVSHTFVATAEAIALLGLKPVFVDVLPDTYTIDPKAIENAITSRTRCIMPVHLYGQSADMEAVMKIALTHDLYVIEDNAQAIGADYIFKDGSRQKTGTIGHIGCTSFYPSKNLGCYGDGGAIFTNDDLFAEKIRLIANHGQQTKYDSTMIGVNSRLDALQAVVLSTKLKSLNRYNESRLRVADFYDEAFKNAENITVPFRVSYSTHVFHQYTLCINGDRDALKQALQEQGIPTMIYYPIPIHLQKAYLPLGYAKGSLPVTEHLAKQVISLPIHTEMTHEQLQYIAQTVLNLIA